MSLTGDTVNVISVTGDLPVTAAAMFLYFFKSIYIIRIQSKVIKINHKTISPSKYGSKIRQPKNTA